MITLAIYYITKSKSIKSESNKNIIQNYHYPNAITLEKHLKYIQLQLYRHHGFFQTFLLLLFSSKNSIFNQVSKLNPTYCFISLQYLIFLFNCWSSLSNTLSTRKIPQIGYIFSVFYYRSAFSSNLAGFELQDFYCLARATMGALWVSLTRTSKNGGKHKCLE